MKSFIKEHHHVLNENIKTAQKVLTKAAHSTVLTKPIVDNAIKTWNLDDFRKVEDSVLNECSSIDFDVRNVLAVENSVISLVDASLNLARYRISTNLAVDRMSEFPTKFPSSQAMFKYLNRDFNIELNYDFVNHCPAKLPMVIHWSASKFYGSTDSGILETSGMDRSGELVTSNIGLYTDFTTGSLYMYTEDEDITFEKVLRVEGKHAVMIHTAKRDYPAVKLSPDYVPKSVNPDVYHFYLQCFNTLLDAAKEFTYYRNTNSAKSVKTHEAKRATSNAPRVSMVHMEQDRMFTVVHKDLYAEYERAERERKEWQGGHHSSPVPHYRRGTIRHYKNGKTVEVKPTYVQSPKYGGGKTTVYNM